MNQADFEKAVAGFPFERTAFFNTVGSTNDVIAEWARQGAKGLCLAAAGEQTQGRGRAGRSWFTPPSSALAFSLLLEYAPGFDSTYLGRVSGLGALAVCEALETLFQANPEIKWPNDVLLGGKKVCGVLPEAHWSGERLQALILGIGINVATSSVPPPEMTHFPASCLEDALGRSVDAALLLHAVLEKLIARKDKTDAPDFLRAWETRLAYKDKQVSAKTDDGQSLQGKLIGLAADGRLKLQSSGGGMQLLDAGEIHALALD